MAFQHPTPLPGRAVKLAQGRWLSECGPHVGHPLPAALTGHFGKMHLGAGAYVGHMRSGSFPGPGCVWVSPRCPRESVLATVRPGIYKRALWCVEAWHLQSCPGGREAALILQCPFRPHVQQQQAPRGSGLQHPSAFDVSFFFSSYQGPQMAAAACAGRPEARSQELRGVQLVWLTLLRVYSQSNGTVVVLVGAPLGAGAQGLEQLDASRPPHSSKAGSLGDPRGVEGACLPGSCTLKAVSATMHSSVH